MTFQQLGALLEVWYQDTEDCAKIFCNQAAVVSEWDRMIERRQDRCRDLIQCCQELQKIFMIIECQLLDISCELKPLEDYISCLEQLIQSPHHVDHAKFYLYNLADCLFIQVHNLSRQAEELALLTSTHNFIRKIMCTLFWDIRCLDGVFKIIEYNENLLLCVTENHKLFLTLPNKLNS